MQIRAEVDHCRPRLLKYCQGQGLDLGCGSIKIKPDAIGIDLNNPGADMNKDARILKDYPDEYFDYVFSSHLLEELANTEATLKEWLRIIKKGGYVVLYQADEEYYYPLGDPACNPNHIHHFSWEKLWAIFEKIGETELIHHQRYAPDPSHEWSFELVIRKKGKDQPITTDSDEAISLLVPTLGRPKDMVIFAKSVDDTTTKKDLVEIVFGIHADDKESLEASAGLSSLGIKVRTAIIDRYKDGRAHLTFLWNQVYKASTAPIVGFFGDDVVFRTPKWDEEVRKEFVTDKNIMVSCNDAYVHQGRQATLFFTHRTLHEKIGYYLNESFRRWFMDTFWSDAFKQAGKMHYRQDIVTAHYSPDIFKERVDKTYSDMQDLKGPDHGTWDSQVTKQELVRVISIIKGQ